jgi:hypothetical protein
MERLVGMADGVRLASRTPGFARILAFVRSGAGLVVASWGQGYGPGMHHHPSPGLAVLLPLIILCGACAPEDEETGLPPDTVGLAPLAERVWMATQMPQQLPLLTFGLSHYGAEGCPVVTQTEDELLLTGDCTWSQGELLGSVSFTATSVIWNDWSMSFGDGTVVAVSGEQILGTTGGLTTDMAVIAEVNAVPVLPEGSGSYTYVDYVVTDWLAYLGDPDAEGTSSDLLGTMVIEDVDSFTVNGTFTEEQRCMAYVDSADLSLEGLELLLSYTVTPEPCDACVDWAVEGSEAGTFCLGG